MQNSPIDWETKVAHFSRAKGALPLWINDTVNMNNASPSYPKQ